MPYYVMWYISGGRLSCGAAPLLGAPRRLRPQSAVARLEVLPVVAPGRHGGGGALQEVGRHHEVHLRDERLPKEKEEEIKVETLLKTRDLELKKRTLNKVCFLSERVRFSLSFNYLLKQ